MIELLPCDDYVVVPKNFDEDEGYDFFETVCIEAGVCGGIGESVFSAIIKHSRFYPATNHIKAQLDDVITDLEAMMFEIGSDVVDMELHDDALTKLKKLRG
jgi:hypothetical protein